MTTTIYFLRHAQGTHNVDFFNKGSGQYTDPVYLDAELTEEGVRQTEAARVEYKDMKFDAIYCSPLRRCRATLLGVYPAAADMNVQVTDSLLEHPTGFNLCDKRLERDMVVSTCPVTWNCDDVSAENPFAKCSETALIRQAVDFIETIKREHANETVLCVTHYTWVYNMSRVEISEHVSLGNCEHLKIAYSKST